MSEYHILISILSLCFPCSSTIVCSKYKFLGTYNESTELYDGAIGEVQRNEMNTFMALVPYSTPYEPGVFVPAPMPAFAPKIYSVPAEAEYIPTNDILYLYANYTAAMWAFIFIALGICSLILVMFDIAISNENAISGETDTPAGDEISAIKSFKRFLDIWYDYFMLSIDNSPITVSKLTSSTILWTSIVIGIYYIIHMVFMNTLSADLAVTNEGRHIETLNDLLYDPLFSSYTPVILGALNMPRELKNSLPDSDEEVLYNWIMRDESISIINFDLDLNNPQKTLTPITSLLEEMQLRERCVIEDSSIFDYILIHCVCHMFPAAYEVKSSKEVIAGAAQAMLVSHDTHPEVVKLFTYRCRAGYESGIATGIARVIMGKQLSDANFAKSVRGFECGEIIEKTDKKYLDKDWIPLQYSFFERMINICFCLLAIACIVLFVERVIYVCLLFEKNLNLMVNIE